MNCHNATIFSFFFFNDTATTEIYTLSLHDALPISLELAGDCRVAVDQPAREAAARRVEHPHAHVGRRSEEHTSELQSPCNLVCRLLLEKKKKTDTQICRKLAAERPLHDNRDEYHDP